MGCYPTRGFYKSNFGPTAALLNGENWPAPVFCFQTKTKGFPSADKDCPSC